MIRPQSAWTALPAAALAALWCGAAQACVLCAMAGDDLHAIPEPSGPAEGTGYYSYDAPLPSGVGSATAVPSLSSSPGAHAKLFLDFDGVDFGTLSWSGKTPGVRPAYDINGDASTFSSEEVRRIHQIWSRVAEAYSPFNIDVTTVDPGNYNRKESAHIVISGDNSWYGGGGGVAYVGGFYSTSTPQVRRTGWVFPGNLRSGDAKVVADAAIHEAGHLFGLQHQSTYNSSGTRTDDYDDNNGSTLRAPNMGVAYDTRRGLWATGATSSATSQVNELSVISRISTNGFGYAPDEPGTSFATAAPMPASGVEQRGVMHASTDRDYYTFTLENLSEVSLLVDVADYGPNLDTRLELYDSTLALLHADDPTLNTSRASLMSGFDGMLAAGQYYVVVGTHGGYTYNNGPRDRVLHDTGQYFLSGVMTALVPEPGTALLLLAGLAAVGGRRRPGG